jgi:hypothetical protein
MFVAGVVDTAGSSGKSWIFIQIECNLKCACYLKILGSVMQKVALGQFPVRVLPVSLSASFRQCSVIICSRITDTI